MSLLSETLKAKTKEEAISLKQDYIKYLMEKNPESKDRIEKIAAENIGYYAGYFGKDVRERVEELFECEHPYFGKIKEMGEPTSEEALLCGMLNVTLKKLREEREIVDAHIKM